MALTFRRATLQDVPALTELAVKRYDLAAEGQLSADSESLSNRWTAAVNRMDSPDKPCAIVLVALDSQGVVGALSSDHVEPHTAELTAWLAVESIAGSSALHRLLLNAMEFFQAQGATTVVAWLPTDEHRMRAALARDGFAVAHGVRPTTCYTSMQPRTPLVRQL